MVKFINPGLTLDSLDIYIVYFLGVLKFATSPCGEPNIKRTFGEFV